MKMIKKIRQSLRNRRFWSFSQKLGRRPGSLQSMMERGWTASVSVVGETPVLSIELDDSAAHYSLPGEDPAAVSAFAAEWNRRVIELHTPS